MNRVIRRVLWVLVVSIFVKNEDSNVHGFHAGVKNGPTPQEDFYFSRPWPWHLAHNYDGQSPTLTQQSSDSRSPVNSAAPIQYPVTKLVNNGYYSNYLTAYHRINSNNQKEVWISRIIPVDSATNFWVVGNHDYIRIQGKTDTKIFTFTTNEDYDADSTKIPTNDFFLNSNGIEFDVSESHLSIKALEHDSHGNWILLFNALSGIDKSGASFTSSDLDLFCSRSSDNGESWSSVVKINEPFDGLGLGTNLHPSCISLGVLKFVCVFVSDQAILKYSPTNTPTVSNIDSGDDFDILITRTTDGGISWSNPRPVFESQSTNPARSGDEFMPKLVILGPNITKDIGIVFETRDTWGAGINENSERDFDVMFAKSTDGGLTWSQSPVVVGSEDSGTHQFNPSIAADPNTGHVGIVLSQKNQFGNNQIFETFSTDFGNSGFSSISRLSDETNEDSTSADFAQIITDLKKMWMVVWHSTNKIHNQARFPDSRKPNEDSYSKDLDIKYVISTSTTPWSNERILNTDGFMDVSIDYRPSITTDGRGDFVAVWVSANKEKVFFAPGETEEYEGSFISVQNTDHLTFARWNGYAIEACRLRSTLAPLIYCTQNLEDDLRDMVSSNDSNVRTDLVFAIDIEFPNEGYNLNPGEHLNLRSSDLQRQRIFYSDSIYSQDPECDHKQFFTLQQNSSIQILPNALIRFESSRIVFNLNYNATEQVRIFKPEFDELTSQTKCSPQRLACPQGFLPPQNPLVDPCEPISEGTYLPEAAQATLTCPINAYCPPGAFDPSKTLCIEHGFGSVTGLARIEQCEGNSQPCPGGSICPIFSNSSQIVPLIEFADESSVLLPLSFGATERFSILVRLAPGITSSDYKIVLFDGEDLNSDIPLWISLDIEPFTGQLIPDRFTTISVLVDSRFAKTNSLNTYILDIGFVNSSNPDFSSFSPLKFNISILTPAHSINPQSLEISDDRGATASHTVALSISSLGCDVGSKAFNVTFSNPGSNLIINSLDWATIETTSGVILAASPEPAIISIRVRFNTSSSRNLSISELSTNIRVSVGTVQGVGEPVTDIAITLVPLVVKLTDRCQPGFFSDTGTTKAEGGCQPCPLNTFSDRPGSTVCTRCSESFPRTRDVGSSNEERDCLTDISSFALASGKRAPCTTGMNCNRIGVTLESLELLPGYWRSTNTSLHILHCPVPEFCVGGPVGSECAANHQGVLCRDCVEGYARAGPRGACEVCSAEKIESDQSRLGASIVGGVMIIIIGFMILHRHELKEFFQRFKPKKVRDEEEARLEKLTSFRKSAKTVATAGQAVARMVKRAVVSVETNTKLKILIGLFQVTNGVSGTFYDLFPPLFHRIVQAFNFLSVNIFYQIDLGCIIESNHYVYLISAIIGPIIVSIVILLTHIRFEWVAKRRGESEEKIDELRSTSFSVFLFLLFIVYPGTSSTILKTFACVHFDGLGSYLRYDLTISCDAPDRGMYLGIAALGVLIYPVGIVLFYAFLLYQQRSSFMIREKNGLRRGSTLPERMMHPGTRHIRFLYEPYKPNFYWFEVFELLRKLVQTSLIVFLLDGSVSQVCIQILVSMIVIQILNEWQPYFSKGSNRLATVAQWQILFVAQIALLNKIDIVDRDERFNVQQTTLDYILIFVCFMAPAFALYQSRKYFIGVGQNYLTLRRNAKNEAGENAIVLDESSASTLASPPSPMKSASNNNNNNTDGFPLSPDSKPTTNV